MSDPSRPGSGPAGWQPDPSGRHQYRYWDGSAWTDNVSDSGATSVDPLAPDAGAAEAVPPTQAMPSSPPTASLPTTPVAMPGPAGPTFAPPTGGPPTAGPPPAAGPPPSGGGSSKAPLIIAAIVVVALVVAGFLLFSGGGGGGGQGAGTFTLDVPKNGSATHKITLKDDELLLVTATPKDKSFDAVLGVAVDVKSAGVKATASIFSDDLTENNSDLTQNGKLPPTVIATSDKVGKGKAEKANLPAAKGFDATIIVGGKGGSAGKVDLKLEVVKVKANANQTEYAKAVCKDATARAFLGEDVCRSIEGGRSDQTASDSTDSSSLSDSFSDFSDPFSDFTSFTDFSDDLSSLLSDFNVSDFFSS